MRNRRRGGRKRRVPGEVVIQRAIDIIAGDRLRGSRFRNRSRLYALWLYRKIARVVKQRAFRLRLEIACKRILRPCLRAIGFRCGCYGLPARNRLCHRQRTFRPLLVLLRHFILRKLAARLKRIGEKLVKRAHGVVLLLCRQMFRNQRARGGNGSRAKRARCVVRQQRVKRAFDIRLRDTALLGAYHIIARNKRIVKRLGKLRLRFRFALLLFVAPCRLGEGNCHLLVRAAAVFAREHGRYLLRFRRRNGFCDSGFRLIGRICFRFRTLFFRARRRRLLLFRQGAVLDAVDVLHQKRWVFARVGKVCVAELADGFVKRVSIQPHFRAVNLAMLHKLGKACRRDLQLACVLLQHGVEGVDHLFVFALDDLRVAQHPLAVCFYACAELNALTLRFLLERVCGVDRFGKQRFRFLARL